MGDTVAMVGSMRDQDASTWMPTSNRLTRYVTGAVDRALWVGDEPATLIGNQLTLLNGTTWEVCANDCVVLPAPRGDLAVIASSVDASAPLAIVDLSNRKTLRSIAGVRGGLLWGSASPASVVWRSGTTLHRWRIDGSEATLETNGEVETALVSPHGDIVLCVSPSEQSWHMWTTTDGSVRPVTMPALFTRRNMMSWSPDGAWIAATPTADSILELFPVA